MSGPSDSCAGACCSVFPMSHSALQMMARGASTDPEATYILDMLIPLTRDEARERTARLGYEWPERDWPEGAYDLFTCRHWDEATRLCTAYDSRPKMCSNYPYGPTCERGCGYGIATKSELVNWDWDAEAKGWKIRLESTDEWAWDPAAAVARKVGGDEDKPVLP